MAYLEIKNVSYTYPSGDKALENVELSFERGENIAIIGQNGAGKTTLSKLMNRLLVPSEGEILVDGISTKMLTTAKVARKVGYVFQNPDEQIFQDTIFKEIAFGLKMLKFSEKEIKEKVEEVAKLCGLERELQEHPYNLPYSKRKFITIAATLAMNPEVIILDEPTAGQDMKSISRLGEILDFLKSQGKIVIIITHDMEFVVKYFNRVVVMASRKKIMDSTPREIFWNKEVLEKARLNQPYICQLAELMGIRDIVTIEELLEKEGK